MAQKLDEIVVIDVEATCWGGPPPPGQTQDLIEVGLCLLDTTTLARHDRVSLLVRPTSSTVSPYCTNLTTLTPEQVGGGISFAEACAALTTHHATHDRAWASWGDFDRTLFERQCARERAPYPFGPTHLNVKHLYALARALPHEIGMMDALRADGIAHEGTHHRGDDDAWNIAALLARLLGAARGALGP
jgi:inhibitor of KinA sporulation pathway (predicted exonuclease)